MSKLKEIESVLRTVEDIRKVQHGGGKPFEGPMPKSLGRGTTTPLPVPLTIARTVGELAKLDKEISAYTLARIIKRIEEGNADEQEVRRVLSAFCRRAGDLVAQRMPPDTLLLVRFVAERFARFLTNREPDLSRAFALKRPTRGRKPQSKTKRREEYIAAQVLEQMHNGKTLDEATEIVAAKVGKNGSTVRNFYSRNKQAAKNILLYRYLLPSFRSP